MKRLAVFMHDIFSNVISSNMVKTKSLLNFLLYLSVHIIRERSRESLENENKNCWINFIFNRKIGAIRRHFTSVLILKRTTEYFSSISLRVIFLKCAWS